MYTSVELKELHEVWKKYNRLNLLNELKATNYGLYLKGKLICKWKYYGEIPYAFGEKRKK
jgi:hypothetical protein